MKIHNLSAEQFFFFSCMMSSTSLNLEGFLTITLISSSSQDYAWQHQNIKTCFESFFQNYSPEKGDKLGINCLQQIKIKHLPIFKFIRFHAVSLEQFFPASSFLSKTLNRFCVQHNLVLETQPLQRPNVDYPTGSRIKQKKIYISV